MHPHFSQLDPMRSPSWRYRRVETLWRNGEQPLRANRYDDQYVRGCLQFLREYQAASALGEQQLDDTGQLLDDSPAMMDLFGRRPDYWYALRMYLDADREFRVVLEAAILAGETDQQVALRMGTLPAAVDVYEKLFYHVRDRLDAFTWIVKAALGPGKILLGRVDDLSPEALREYQLKSFAYGGGSHALDAILSSFEPGGRPCRPEDVEAWVTAKFKGALKVKAATTLQTLQPDKFTSMQLVHSALRASENDNRDGEKEADRQATSIEKAVAGLIEEVSWELAVTQEKTPLQQKFSGAVEPRANEQMMLAAGIEPSGLAERCRQAEANLAERRHGRRMD